MELIWTAPKPNKPFLTLSPCLCCPQTMVHWQPSLVSRRYAQLISSRTQLYDVRDSVRETCLTDWLTAFLLGPVNFRSFGILILLLRPAYVRQHEQHTIRTRWKTKWKRREKTKKTRRSSGRRKRQRNKCPIEWCCRLCLDHNLETFSVLFTFLWWISTNLPYACSAHQRPTKHTHNTTSTRLRL